MTGEKKSAHQKSSTYESFYIWAKQGDSTTSDPTLLYSRDENILSFFLKIGSCAACLGIFLHLGASLYTFTDVYNLQACPYPAATAHSL